MAFFQNSVLNKHLKGQNAEMIKAAYQKFTAYFHNPAIQQNIREAKEEQFQEGFLRELFVHILGYTLNPQPNFNLTTELKNEIGAKKCDGAILQDGKALGVIELKGTDTKDLDKINVQAFNYKNNQTGCVYVITSNFEKLRFFIHHSVEHLEFNLFTLTETEFQLLWLCLRVDNLLNGVPLKVKEESLLEEEKITKQLYKDYATFRYDLWQNMVKNNARADKLLLFKKTQKLLDRYLFIFFAEDSGLLPPNSISRIIERWEILKREDAYKPLYDIFKQYFAYIDTGRKGQKTIDDIFAYNGGLFQPDELLDTIVLDDEILYSHVMKLTNYDFQSEVDVNILGHIFENSLNEIENITAQLEGQEIDKSKTKRKKDGVFYTPKYITKYIVDNTVGKLCEEKKAKLGIIDEEYDNGRRKRKKDTIKGLDENLQAYRNWLLNITICDPACGSGAFLNQALEFLMEEHAYIDELQAQLFGASIVFQDVSNHILEKNIFGVDINNESVEIAKLSLWLRTAQKGRKLTSLNNNIKCGNSLIDDPDVAGEKAFNWQKEFPVVFDPLSGSVSGFDVVIGNPPYVQSHSIDENTKEFIYGNYKTAEYQINTYAIFIEKLISIISNSGRYSVIIPNYWLSTQYDSRLRKLIFLENKCDEILNVFRVFEDATVDTVILTGARTQIPLFPKMTYANSIDYNIKSIQQRLSAIDGKLWTTSKQVEFKNTNADTLISFNEKLVLKGKKTVGFYIDGYQGMKPYEKGKGTPPQTREMMQAKVYHSETKKDNTFYYLIGAANVQRFYLKRPTGFIKYGKNLAAPRKLEIFTGPRLLLNRILSKDKIDVTYEDEIIINNTDVFNLLPKEGTETFVKPILAVIGSKVCSKYFKLSNINLNRQAFPKLNVNNVLAFPIPDNLDDCKDDLINFVDAIMSSFHLLMNVKDNLLNLLQSNFDIEKPSKNLQNWHELKYKDFLKELKKAKVQLSLPEEAEWMQYFNEQKKKAQELKSEIKSVDAEIDQMVYELYELTEEEIKIVEGC